MHHCPALLITLYTMLSIVWSMSKVPSIPMAPFLYSKIQNCCVGEFLNNRDAHIATSHQKEHMINISVVLPYSLPPHHHHQHVICRNMFFNWQQLVTTPQPACSNVPCHGVCSSAHLVECAVFVCTILTTHGELWLGDVSKFNCEFANHTFWSHFEIRLAVSTPGSKSILAGGPRWEMQWG